MTAQAADRIPPRRDAQQFEFPVLASTLIYAGALVCINSSGWATKGAVATTLKCVGIAEERADNSAGANGAINVKVRRGTFRFANSASTDLITRAEINANCYIVDDQTVAKTDGSSARSVAGKIVDVDADGVWVQI